MDELKFNLIKKIIIEKLFIEIRDNMFDTNIGIKSKPLTFPPALNGGGIMGQLLREYDWTKSELGPILNWPQSLLTSINIVLSSR